MHWPLSFCPDCGNRLPAPDGDEPVRLQTCPACGGAHYQNAKPCAGVLVMGGRRVLPARRAGPPRAGAWDVIGGFLGPDDLPDDLAFPHERALLRDHVLGRESGREPATVDGSGAPS